MTSSLRSPLSLLALLLALTVLACTPIRRGSGGGGGGGSSDDDDSAAGDDDDTVIDDDDAAAGDDDDATGCPDIQSVDPEPDQADVYGDTVEVTWDSVPDGGDVSVAHSSGSPVGGSITTDANGRTLVFTANDPFAASTTYTVTASQDCTDDVEYSFSTGP